MRITQKTIARDLGISLVTVNRALNNSGYVSKQLKERISAYVQERSYVPHRASQVLVRNTIRTLAVFSSTTPGYFWDDIKRGVLNAAKYVAPFNYEVHYHRIPDYDTKKFIRLLKQEIEGGLSAAAFVSVWFYDMAAILGMVEKAGIPYVFYNVDAPETKRICYIGADYSSGGRLAANFIGKSLSMFSGGRILCIAVSADSKRYTNEPDINAARLRGFREAMEEMYPGIKIHLEFVNINARISREKQIRVFLEKYEHKVNAVYFIPAYNSQFLGQLIQFNYRNSITVLHDIDDMTLSCLKNNFLTASVYQDPVLQGFVAIRTLERILETKELIKDIEIPHTLIFKENVDFLKNHYSLVLAESDGI
ncbi:MAG: LacI family transcriptional regulator [Treponema sp.]|jgi:LacI family transcriptional regulator|nr:LacI family transcriptional regulator [Treponema sp.]